MNKAQPASAVGIIVTALRQTALGDAGLQSLSYAMLLLQLSALTAAVESEHGAQEGKPPIPQGKPIRGPGAHVPDMLRRLVYLIADDRSREMGIKELV